MIEYRTGDILGTDAEALVNTVNCVGVMGRGIALQFKNAYPANFKAYEAACRREDIQPGRMFVFETGYLGNPKYIINFPTKRHWRGKSSHRGYRRWPQGSRPRNPSAAYPLDRASTSWQWTWRARLARRARAD